MRIKRAQIIIVLLALALVAVSAMLLQSNRNREKSVYQQIGPKILFRENEHLFGKPAASVKIVEYVEAECPYCKKLHPVLLRIVEEGEGKVALVYRHFPLTIHPKSFIEAVALECAAEAGGNASFWSYLEALYEATPSNDKIDLAILPELAQTVGISKEIFNDCLASDRHKARVLDDIESGFALDVDSVPQLFVTAPNGKVFVFRNSPSYAVLNATVLAALELTN